MRSSNIIALCAAPLALAMSIQEGLVARGVAKSELVVRNGADSESSSLMGRSVVIEEKNKTEEKLEGTKEKEVKDEKEVKKNDGKGNENDETSLTQVTEIIIIWTNKGGNAADETVNKKAPVNPEQAAATHRVVVGGADGLVYTPPTIAAAVGDMVIFEFMSANHTTTQSTFDLPCDPLAGGMDSGFMPNKNNSVIPPPQMAMQVTVSTPLWFYCKQNGHCGKGMVFSINPTAEQTQDAFVQAAIAQKGTPGGAGPPPGVPPSVVVPGSLPAAEAPAHITGGIANAGGSIVPGVGTLSGAGTCSCSCLCGAAAFPDAAIQGLGAFGGLAGAIPMSSLEK